MGLTPVEKAGHDIERVLIIVGYTLARFFYGPAYQENTIHPLQRARSALRHDMPLGKAAKSGGAEFGKNKDESGRGA
jgi:hypothetical protein